MANLRWLRLPAEMRARRQWAVSTLLPKADGKPDKAPRNPLTRELCSPTDPRTWGTFEEAMNSGLPAIGFMLTGDDPFVVIDLDDKGDLTEEIRKRHIRIYTDLQSYSERSQSGLGLHIILRGKIGGGLNRDHVEVYDQERYIICTGDVVRDMEVEESEYLLPLVEQMGGVQKKRDILDSSPERYTDEELMSKMLNARNAEKFKDLYYRAPRVDEDWSQRDAALAQMIAFYTRNHEQAIRIFAGSALWRPHDKGKNPQHYVEDYLLARTFGRAWTAEAARDADIELGRELAQRALAQVNGTPVQAAPKSEIEFPQGMVGEIADYIYHAAPRPVREVALAGALAFCSGLFGRQYNVMGSGLNQYIILLADTGRGKEAAPSGVEALVNQVKHVVPAIETFMGPAYFGSGQGLVRSLDKQPSLYSAIGEFGHVLARVTNPKASTSDQAFRQMMLALYMKSGKGQVLRPTAYSDSDKNTLAVEAPAFSFLGDSTPEAFYGSVNSSTVGEGLLPRFLLIKYDGPRPPTNYDRRLQPRKELVDKLGAAALEILHFQASNTFVDIPFDPEAREIERTFDRECDDLINADTSGGSAEIWNRAHLMMLRVAGIVAVGRNHRSPLIIPEDVNWAMRLVKASAEEFAHRLGSGDVGTGETRRSPLVERAILDYLRMDPDKKRVTYKVPKALDFEPSVIPYGYFRRRFKHNSSFMNDNRGLVSAIKAALQDAVELGILQVMSDEQKLLKGGRDDGSPWYVLGPNWSGG